MRCLWTPENGPSSPISHLFPGAICPATPRTRFTNLYSPGRFVQPHFEQDSPIFKFGVLHFGQLLRNFWKLPPPLTISISFSVNSTPNFCSLPFWSCESCKSCDMCFMLSSILPYCHTAVSDRRLYITFEQVVKTHPKRETRQFIVNSVRSKHKSALKFALLH